MSTVISTAANTNLVDSTRWEDMTFSELIEQKNVLMNRYEFLMQQENKSYVGPLIQGIQQIDALIQTKTIK